MWVKSKICRWHVASAALAAWAWALGAGGRARWVACSLFVRCSLFFAVRWSLGCSGAPPIYPVNVSPVIQGAIPRLGTGLRSYSLAATNSRGSVSDVWRYVDDEALQTDLEKKEREAEIYSSSGYGVATYLIGICAMERKARSKPMTALVNRLDLVGDLRTIVFPERLILDKNVADWPVVDVLIAWYSGGGGDCGV